MKGNSTGDGTEVYFKSSLQYFKEWYFEGTPQYYETTPRYPEKYSRVYTFSDIYHKDMPAVCQKYYTMKAKERRDSTLEW